MLVRERYRVRITQSDFSGAGTLYI
jgi:hypothetical protein